MILQEQKINPAKIGVIFFKKSVDKPLSLCYDKRKLKLTQTYEVEIRERAMMEIPQ